MDICNNAINDWEATIEGMRKTPQISTFLSNGVHSELSSVFCGLPNCPRRFAHKNPGSNVAHDVRSKWLFCERIQDLSCSSSGVLKWNR